MTFSKLGTDIETHQTVYLPKASRLQGLYIIGIQGTGKSGLIENLIMQDIDQQIGVCVLDPHGELIDHVIARLPGKAEEDKVILLDLSNYSYPFGLNLFACPDPTDDGEIVKTLYQVLHVFEKAYGIVPTTPLMYDLLYHTVYTLIANPGYTMIDIRLLLTNEACRKKLATNVPNDDIKDFWRIWDDPKQTSPSKQQEDRKTILNKMNDFLHVPLRNIVGQSNTTFSLQDIMDTGKIMLVKLSRRLEQPSNLIGSILIAQLLNAAYARPTHKRKQFHLYADEFQNFATEDFATLLEEARKFGIGTTIAHQNRGQLHSANSQLETDLKDRSRSVGNMVVFKINSKDADELVGEFKITPQAAWEEEIEKEWHERKEEEVIDGTEPIRTMKQGDIIQHIYRNGHSSKRVMELFATHIQSLNSYLPDPGKDKDLDRILALGMQGKFWHTSKEVQEKLMDRIKYYSYWGSVDFCRPGLWQFDFSGLNFEYPLRNDIDAIIQNLFATLSWDNKCKVYTIPQSIINDLQAVSYWHNLKYLFCRVMMSLYAEPKTQAEIMWENVEAQRKQTEEEQLSRASHLSYGWMLQDSEYLSLSRLFQKEREDRVILLYRTGLNDPDPVMVARKAKAWQKAQEETTRLVNFIWGITQLAYELSKPENHILEDSGQQQPRKRKQINYLTHPRKTIMHPQRTYQDVQNELATQLVSLPNFSARVKIGVNAPQNPGKKCLSCKLLNNSGALYCTGCGKELPAANEYVITTLQPPKGTQHLDQRIKRIQANNLRDGYVRNRVDVEAELVQRQQRCSGSSVAAQPQPVQQQSPRHARQVPVQGKCPKCGASNAPGSKFCNQCGKQL